MLVDLEKLPDHTRVWIYAANRNLTESEASDISVSSLNFVEQWTAHNVQLQASSTLLHNRFLVLAVDEMSHGASGCSIDSSVRFVQTLEKEGDLSFMNGGKVCLQTTEGIKLLSTQEVKKLSADSAINEGTIMYDHLVKDLGQLRSEFEKPVRDSWLNRFLLKKEEV